MINLLKADFFRVLRTKIVYISLIVAVGLPLFIAGTFALSGVGAYTPEETEMMKYTYGNMLMTAPFSSLLSFSFVFAIFPVIVIIMDFGNGTMRDKIIHGYTRHQIYAAHFIITFAYVFLLTLSINFLVDEINSFAETTPNFSLNIPKLSISKIM